MDDADTLIVGGGSAGSVLAARLSEDVGRRVNMRIHETGDRAYRRWWGWEESNLREYLTGADNCRQPGTADDRSPSFEQCAASCMTVLHVAIIGAANVYPPGHTRPSAAISEFPSRDIGPAHCDPPLLSPKRSALQE